MGKGNIYRQLLFAFLFIGGLAAKAQDPEFSQFYANRLYHLHKWLSGRNFEFNNFVHTGENSFQNQRENVTLQGLEHLLHLFP